MRRCTQDATTIPPRESTFLSSTTPTPSGDLKHCITEFITRVDVHINVNVDLIVKVAYRIGK